MKSDFLSLLKSRPDLNSWSLIQTSGQLDSDILPVLRGVDFLDVLAADRYLQLLKNSLALCGGYHRAVEWFLYTKQKDILILPDFYFWGSQY